MTVEKKFENQVKLYLESKDAWYIKYWAGAEYTKSGIPDILACVYGIFYGIEIKAPNGKPSMLQLVNLKKIREAGGIGLLLYPKDFEKFKSFIDRPDEEHSFYLDNIQEQSKWVEKLSS